MKRKKRKRLTLSQERELRLELLEEQCNNVDAMTILLRVLVAIEGVVIFGIVLFK